MDATQRWWPCPGCRSKDPEKVVWSDWRTIETTTAPTAERPDPTFHLHFQETMAWHCSACGQSGREVVVVGAKR
ncbi:hypothetical protein OG871_33165 [Kitasatospora sp. NBC_00374]|uniref:hypothetical protein n=1 Tax=Kitasatospora sp. NBC_00374 TaxID=2975964 RepID=UPI0032474E48